jgi:predicted nucleic acid-binding Zn ribbon protein
MTKPRIHHSRSISEVLKEMRSTYKLDQKLSEVGLTARWPELVGDLIARHTTGLRIKEDVLTIYVDNAPLRHELTNRKEEIRQLVNRDAGTESIREVLVR